jgi:hypothetical protein
MMRLLHLVRQNIVFIVVLGLLLVGFSLLKQDSSVGSPADLDAALSDGRPTVLEFFSNT